MHKLMEYICGELEDIERKAGKGSKLSMQEIQYVDTLAHAKKNLMKCDEMEGGQESYSMRGYSRRMSYADGGSYDGEGSYDDGRYVRPDGSYARGRGPGAKRDSMGRYSSEGVDEQSKKKLIELIEKM